LQYARKREKVLPSLPAGRAARPVRLKWDKFCDEVTDQLNQLRLWLLLFFASLGVSAQTRPLAIVGATLVDGTGRPAVRDAVLVMRGERLLAVGPRHRIKLPPDAQAIKGQGLVVAPGFIDTHNHSQAGLDKDPTAATQVAQGITTVALGQDGNSAWPVGAYLSQREASPVALNVLTFVGHATLREQALGQDYKRAATPGEIRRMEQLAEQAMREGAFGLSSGLEYEVGKSATTEEIIALARVVGRHKGIYISHIRDEADLVFDALREVIRIARESGAPAQISHIKLGTVKVWGQARQAIALIRQAQKQGLDITADCYPYDAWHSTIRVLVPSERHDDPVAVARGLADVGGAQNVTVVNCPAHPDYEFKTLAEIAAGQKTTPVEIYMKITRDGGASVVARSMTADDIRAFYRQPWVMACSDGGLGMRHPRGAGTYPRILGRFVRERKWLTLEEAIRKMTSLPARRLGLKERGQLKAGMKADVVLFDPARVIDRATFAEPQLLAEGARRVFVNGAEVWRDGAITGQTPGQIIRRPHP
jgi:N-acyl-D-amino-acid deacylase